MRDAPTFEIENSLAGRIEGPVAGIDEAGRGPLAGPVVAAAVILNPDAIPAGLADSKTLTERRREHLAKAIRESAVVGVGLASVSEIDAINILQASLLAMRRAVDALDRAPAACLVDGNQDPKLSVPAQLVVKGDARSLSIAAASIIAKTTRDAMMRDLDADFPGYGWASNKGYGARVHMDALERLGPTPHHRKSFAPVARAIAARETNAA
ncbi:MAG: ribonuclease HII [Pseudomonadota bacterium]